MQSTSKKLTRVFSSVEIRKTFIDYFIKNHDHQFVRSSPLLPLCDPSLAFVNAGMNQFKSIFLGKSVPTHKRVVNSQKCVRVGGKHNDLDVVGQDSYHHTFFEMLGNWSFGDYFKSRACAMAIDMLNGQWGISADRLYFTYFGGDEALGLPADIESFEIWKSLGIPASRILPFGSKDNFWEMGPTGPCGPCTEIHIDLHPQMDANPNGERAKLVNAGHPDVIELWNLVFIQYDRNIDGSITELPDRHVDTGMGLERLTAILQNKRSNYDTDLFVPIINQIQQVTNAPPYRCCFNKKSDSYKIDTSYRILSDHVRMLVTCLADGMLPDHNYKLRRVLRRAQTISENVFLNNDLLSKLIPIVVETLGPAYPELYSKENAIKDIIEHEKEVFRAIRDSSKKNFSEISTKYPELNSSDFMEVPGFIPAYREFKRQKQTFKNNTIPGNFLYMLNDTFGLTSESFNILAEMEGMLLDFEGYLQAKADAKLRIKNFISDDKDLLLQRKIETNLIKITQDLSPTDTNPKYNYMYEESINQYKVVNVWSNILRILLNDLEVTTLKGIHVTTSDRLYIITNRSNFYNTSGGQQSDQGTISIKSSKENSYEINVIDVEFINSCVIHVCKVTTDQDDLHLSVGNAVEFKVNAEHRHLNTVHHTGTHLLNEAVRSLFNKTTYQVSSEVNNKFFKLELGIIGKNIEKEDVANLEDLTRKIIHSGTSVNVRIVSESDVLQERDITTVPGEIYPANNLRLVEIINTSKHFCSKELCCGTHVFNTEHLENICITQVKQTNRARYNFIGVAGPLAKQVLDSAANMEKCITTLEENFLCQKQIDAIEKQVQEKRNQILHTDLLLPHVFKIDMIERINLLIKQLKEKSRSKYREYLNVEIQNVMKNKPIESYKFIVHFIPNSFPNEISLQKATKFCTDRPILVAGLFDGTIKARCCVPKTFINKKFNAELWLKEFAKVFGSQVSTPRGQNAKEVCNMKGKSISSDFTNKLDSALLKTNEYANKYYLLLNSID